MSAIELSSYVGLTALTLLTLNICLGLLIASRYNTVKRWPRRRINTFKWHKRTGYTALVVSAAHPVVLLASTSAEFRLIDILVPVNAPKQPFINSLGALALYSLVVVVGTSYFRIELGRKVWKRIHFSAYAMAALMFVHSLLTDPKLKDTAFDPLDAEKLYVELLLAIVIVAIALRVRSVRRRPRGIVAAAGSSAGSVHAILVTALIAASASTASGQRAPRPSPIPDSTAHIDPLSGARVRDDGARERPAGWSYEPDAGFVYQRGNFRWLTWGYAERHWGVGGMATGSALWRRVRQGMELDLPRFGSSAGSLRPAFVYEVDLTDNNFFRAGPAWKVWENFYVALQDANDLSAVRVVFGQNTHILTYEDNLSSGNLPTINRSLVLEEHGSTNSFGTQWGLQATKALTPRIALAVSAQDNRGSLNTDRPRWTIGNSLAAKLTATVLQDTVRHHRLVLGTGIDHTGHIEDRRFTLASAILSTPLGGTAATGAKLTGEAYFMYTSALARSGAHPFTVDGEGLWSRYSESGTSVAGGFVQAQLSLFDARAWGDLDPFLRYDVLRLSRSVVARGFARQSAVRAGVNYNLPYTNKLLNLHVEGAWNRVRGPAALVPSARSFREVTVGLRVNTTRYLRH